MHLIQPLQHNEIYNINAKLKSLADVLPIYYEQATRTRSAYLGRAGLLAMRDWGQWFYRKRSCKTFRPDVRVWRVIKMTVPE